MLFMLTKRDLDENKKVWGQSSGAVSYSIQNLLRISEEEYKLLV